MSTQTVAVLVGVVAAFLAAPLISVLTTRPPLRDTSTPPRWPFRCDTCGTALSWAAVTPIVSWIVRRGRCRTCGAPISRWDLGAEIGSLLAGALIGWRIGWHPELAAFLVAGLVCVSVVLVDLQLHKIATKLVYPLAAATAVLLGAAAVVDNRVDDLVRALLAGIVASLFFWILILIVPTGMGDGDARLALVLGMLLGWYSWKHVYLGLMAGFLLGSVFGVILMVVKRAGRKTQIAFGPYLIAGAFWLALWPGLADRFLQQ